MTGQLEGEQRLFRSPKHIYHTSSHLSLPHPREAEWAIISFTFYVEKTQQQRGIKGFA